MDHWAAITAGRESFADYLTTLTAEEWAQPSLCSDWSVKDVAAHMLVIPTMSKGKVFRSFASSGFNLDKMNAKLVSQMTSTMTAEQIAAATRESAGSHGMPPGLKLPGVLTELVIHSGDIAGALGGSFALPVDDYVAGLEHLKDAQPVFGCKERIKGLRLVATDADWSTGDGPSVEGGAQDLLMAMTGRAAAFASLAGEGVATMRSR